MIKKIIYILVTILIIVTAVYTSYRYLTKQSNITSDLVDVVPINSPAFIEIKNFPDFINNVKDNDYWQDLINIAFFNKLNEYINFIDSVLLKQQEISQIINKNPVIISMHMVGKSDYQYMLYVNLNNSYDLTKTYDFIKSKTGSKATINERNYNNRTIYDVKLANQEKFKNFSFTVSNNVFIFSLSSLLIEDAIRQQDSKISIKKDKIFEKVSATAGQNVGANIYINHETFNDLVSLYIDKDYKSYIKSFTNYAKWTELDANIKDDYVLLNGFTIVDDSSSQYLNLFLEQEPVRSRIDRILPSNTSVILSLGISNLKQYYNDRMNYLKDIGKFEKVNEQNETINKATDIKPIDLFLKFYENEAALVYTDINMLDIHQNSYVVIGTSSSSLAKKEMLQYLENYANNNNIPLETLTDIITIDSETSFEYYKNPYPYLPSLIYGNVFSQFKANYFCFYDNYMIFSSTEKGLKSFLFANILNKTLNNDITYSNFKEYLSDKYNFYFYVNPGIASHFIKNYFDKSLKSELDSNLDIIRKFQSFAVQLIPNKKMIYNNILLKYYPVIKEKPRTVWESKLDTISFMKPKFVINHRTGEKEIFIQDVKNNIYLINNSGRIQWKLHIEEPIMSEIYQVDYYKNNKLQILFSTKNKIYIIDRLGNNVENYPVELRAPATNGIALFDYENNRNYRIFIACDDHHVYSYDIEGKLVKGWEFDITDKFVYQPLQYFTYDNTDYLIFKDSLKTYIVDRRGRTRIDVNEFFSSSPNNTFYFDVPYEKKSPCFITTDIKGEVIIIDLEGNVKHKKLDNFSIDHYFIFKDFDGDGHSDYIFADNNLLKIYNNKGDQILNKTFENKISYAPNLYEFTSNNIKIGLVFKEKNELYLINNDGDIYEGFPLKGFSSFTIGHISSNTGNNYFNLFTVSEDGFLYNYEVP